MYHSNFSIKDRLRLVQGDEKKIISLSAGATCALLILAVILSNSFTALLVVIALGITGFLAFVTYLKVEERLTFLRTLHSKWKRKFPSSVTPEEIALYVTRWDGEYLEELSILIGENSELDIIELAEWLETEVKATYEYDDRQFDRGYFKAKRVALTFDDDNLRTVSSIPVIDRVRALWRDR